MLFRFHPSFAYGFNGCVSSVGAPLQVVSAVVNTGLDIHLPCVVECTSAPYSTSTVSAWLSVNLQNSLSTSSSETTAPPIVLGSGSPGWILTSFGSGRCRFHQASANASSRAWNEGMECSSPSSKPKSSPWLRRQGVQYHSSFLGTAANGGSRQ
jgi:hypothetical protein